MAVNQGLDADMKSLMVMEHFCTGVAMNSNDAAEGVAAFLDNREPVWTGSSAYDPRRVDGRQPSVADEIPDPAGVRPPGPARRLPWRTLSLEDVVDGIDGARPQLPRPLEPWDDMSLIYTSGTTGPSKGVRAAYATFWNYHRVFLEPYVGEHDRFLQPLPMFHTAGTGITYSMLLAGGSVALIERFSARTFLDDTRRLGTTATLVLH